MAATLAQKSLGAPSEKALLKGSEEWERHLPTEKIDERDVGTPDGWIPRNPVLLRHTGRHPFNCEAPLDQLVDAGFITPVSMHYVRNHGAVPKLDWKSHRIEIRGLVDRPMSLTMDDILKFRSITIPVTLACAGNRRKETNMLKKTVGFNWGPGVTSCSYWTGVRLCDLLMHVGTKLPGEGANYVCFRGPTGEVPKGDDGSYGTSVNLGHALDPSNEIMLAYKQNGRWLTPDHGFPIRVIVPGFTAGRMVKWLSEITVSDRESNNFYHYNDNRVLPPHVDEALSKEEGWVYKPEFIVNELNINAAVARPCHDETLILKAKSPYTIKGYAYTGGGRKVIRVEVSLDGGKNWRLAQIDRMDAETPFGKSWTWSFWRLEVHPFDFLHANELVIRAVDSAQNFQPDQLTWNMMGMMTNCHFRIRVHKKMCDDGTLSVRFQHPAPPEVGALGNVGWREEEFNEKAKEETPTAVVAPLARLSSLAPIKLPSTIADLPVIKTYTMTEVAEHITDASCWFVHEGKVYDVTSYLDEHPGGAESILLEAGSDATVEFNAIHSLKARSMLENYYIGDLKETEAEAKTEVHVAREPVVHVRKKVDLPVVVEAPLALSNPKVKIHCTLTERIELNHNTLLLRYALPSPDQKLGLPVGQHMYLYADIDGEMCMRAYTPTSSDEIGFFDLVIKIYRPNEHPDFPEGGKMSAFLEKMKIGDTISIKGPTGHFKYMGKGEYVNNRRPGKAQQLSMIAAGTGITPMYQVIKAVLNDPFDETDIKLLYVNRHLDDILLREELDQLALLHPNFNVWYTLTAPPQGWGYSTGRVNLDMLDRTLFSVSQKGLVLMCGPQAMLDGACKPNLEKLGWDKTQMMEF